MDLLEPFARSVLCLRAEQRQQEGPVAGGSLSAYVDRADAGKLAQREDMAEGRVVAKVQPQASGVEEDKLAGNSEFQLAFLLAELLGDLRELGESFLNRCVLERIKLDRAQRSVKRDHEVPSTAAHIRAGLPFSIVADGLRRRSRHAAPPRMALLTAFLTTMSFSPAARLSDSAAFGELILPSAMAAQARISESSFLPMNPLALRSPSRSGTPPSPERIPKASKNAIFSVRLLSRSAFPLIAASMRGKAARELRAPSA